jgi:outer membrane lipoprotein carrier protein
MLTTMRGLAARTLCLTACAVLATLPLPAHAAAPGVKELAARVDQHYNRLHSLEVAFVQTYTGMGLHKREAGALLLKKPGRMRWTYTQPDGKLYVLDGRFGYFYTPGQTEAQKVPAKKLDDLQSPLRYLLGHTELMRELPDLHLVSEQNGEFTLAGVPRGMQKSIASVTLQVTADGYIREIRVAQTDGIVNELDFSGETDNVPAPPSAFVFHPPAGVYVVNSLTPME